MVDSRFHIFSLIAVFLALAAGMVIGSALAASGALADKQRFMVEELQKEFASLRQRERAFAARVAVLEEEARRDADFASVVAPLLVGSRLTGMRLVVAADGVDAAARRSVVETLKGAGAEVREALLPVAGGAAGGAGYWREAGLRWGWSLAEGRPDAAVLLVQPGRRGLAATEALLAGVIEALRGVGVPAVGAETRDSRPSLVPFYRRVGVSSVDDADLLAGRVALVYLAAGATGHYGVKATADAFLPPLDLAGGRRRDGGTAAGGETR